jgi:putative cell wall-binding protein
VQTLTVAGSALSVSDGIKNSLPVPSITRIGGTDRYDTSEQLNRAAFSRAKTVFLATGEDFPDALSGAAAAGYLRSPLFAVPPTCVPRAVLTDIARSGATQVVLLGGPDTLSDSVARLTPCG